LFKLFNKIKDKNLRDLFMYYSDYIDGQHDHLLRLEKRIEEFSKDEKYKPSHDALICLRGLQTLSAMTLIAELGDINRFSHPKKLSSYIGLDIAEYSSGGKEKKLGITKAGNGRVRTCLIETQQLLLKSPTVGTVVNRRRKNADPKILAIARKCDDRIYNKARHLMMRGKHTNKIKVACARELVGFIWEIMKCSRGNQILPARSVMA
jgi:transposase